MLTEDVKAVCKKIQRDLEAYYNTGLEVYLVKLKESLKTLNDKHKNQK